MYRVEYYCPRQAPFWQPVTESQLLVFKVLKRFPSLESAQDACNRLVWQYHSARVVDGMGNVVYQV